MNTPPSELLRLFVAAELPAEVREALAALQAELKRRGLEPLRWVRPEGIHLTLKFLGETPADRLPAICKALAQAVKGVPPHRLSLGTPGSFGNRRGPQVLWVDLKGDLAVLGQLQRQVEEELKAVGFPREKRQFAPHLTIARVRPESARALAARIADLLRQVEPPRGEVGVREISLIRSTLQPGGAVYERLDAFALGIT